jgi:tetratricopeptide (TPR) repeat protein
MFFNNMNFPKLILMFSFSLLVACANKQALVESDPLLESARIQLDKEQAQFKQALGLIQAGKVNEKDLLKAKEILDALYLGNSAYLGALINSADISFKLEKLDEATMLYLDAIQKIENQKVEGEKFESAAISTNKSQVVSENISMFTVHAYNQLGLITRQQGQFDQAEAYYRQALALDAESLITLKNLAILLDLYKGKLAEALVLYEQYQSKIGGSGSGSDSQVTDSKIKDWIYDLKNRLPAEEASNE